MDDFNDAQHEVWERMRAFNHDWANGRCAELGSYLHPDVVMVFPGFSGSAEGRDVLVASFEDYAKKATTLAFEERDPIVVDVVGDTAIVSFGYAIIYAMDGKRFAGTGRDFWVFARTGGDWLAVWRTMLDMEERELEDE